MRVSLYPVELLGGFVFAGTWGLYRYFGMPLRSPWELYCSRVLGGFGWYLLGLSVTVLFLRLRDLATSAPCSRAETWRSFRTSYLSPAHLLRDFRFVHALGVTFFLFIQLKNLIPHVNGRVFDQLLFQQETSLLGGRLAAEWVMQALGHSAAELLSAGYVFFFPYMGLLLAVMVLQRDECLASRFVLGFFSVWIIGVFIVYAFPTWGPCFFSPEMFRSLPVTDVTFLQQNLWKEKLFLESEPASPRGTFLISGLPSLHVAVVVFGSLCLSRVARLLAVFSWFFAGITFLTTLYFGWHYLLDDIGGILLGWGIFRVCVTPGMLPRLLGIEPRKIT